MPTDIITPKDYWRGLILLGLNTATYKIALAKSLMSFVEEDKTHVPMNDLSKEFFNLYLNRLINGKPQLMLPGRLTVMERIVQKYKLNVISEDQAIDNVKSQAFGDVIPRFHTLEDNQIPIRFYEVTNSGLVITDHAFTVLSSSDKALLLSDLNTRWDLLEAAFVIRRENYALQNDLRNFYLSSGYERKPITKLRPALNGYQKGICFYCGEAMGDDVHVDHVIPRQVVNHDEVRNLVLAHGFCNEQKSDFLPSIDYVEQLIHRNEFLIASNHPLKQEIIEKLGISGNIRRDNVLRIYHDAELILGCTWEGVKGYSPRTDPLYHFFVQHYLK